MGRPWPEENDEDAAASSGELLGPLLEDWRDVLVKHVLKWLDPTGLRHARAGGEAVAGGGGGQQPAARGGEGGGASEDRQFRWIRSNVALGEEEQVPVECTADLCPRR